MHVVVAQDAVDTELGAESAEVTRCRHQSLEREHGSQNAGEGRLLDDLGGRCVICSPLANKQLPEGLENIHICASVCCASLSFQPRFFSSSLAEEGARIFSISAVLPSLDDMGLGFGTSCKSPLISTTSPSRVPTLARWTTSWRLRLSSAAACLSFHLPVGVSSHSPTRQAATNTIKTPGTTKATRHALWLGSPSPTSPLYTAGMTKYVIPPPRFPSPPASAFAVPTTFLSKKPVVHTWHGTKLPPRTPMKKRSAYRPEALYTAPARKVGSAPARRQPAKVRRGPKWSQQGPAMRRTISVAVSAMMLLFATSCCCMWMSPAMTSARRGGKAGVQC